MSILDGVRLVLWPVLKLKDALHRALYRLLTNRRLAGDGFDRAHGTDTSRLLESHAPDGARVYRYETAGIGAIHAALRSVPGDLSECAFVDLGCGLGRPLIIAAGYPFRRVIGVDISSACIAIATRNMAAAGVADRVELCVADAAGYELPRGPLVVYLFNPFPAPIMARVVAGLEERLRDSTQRVAVVYMHPVHADLFERSGLFEKVAHVPGTGAPHEAAVVFVSRLVLPQPG